MHRASEPAVVAAAELGLATVIGDATHNAVLDAAGIARARALIVAPSRDDTAILITLTARRLAPDVPVTSASKRPRTRCSPAMRARR